MTLQDAFAFFRRLGVNPEPLSIAQFNGAYYHKFPRFRIILALSRELQVQLRDLFDEELLASRENDDRGGLECVGRILLHDLSDDFLAIAGSSCLR